MPTLWYPCCGGGGGITDCILCSSGTTPTQLQITLPSVGDGTCDCSNIAGTYILDQTEADSCIYSNQFDIDMGSCGTYTYTVEAYWFLFLNQENCIAFIHKTGDTYDSAQWTFIGSNPPAWDCTGSRTLTFFFSGTGSGPCDWDNITGSVSWLALY